MSQTVSYRLEDRRTVEEAYREGIRHRKRRQNVAEQGEGIPRGDIASKPWHKDYQISDMEVEFIAEHLEGLSKATQRAKGIR
jgi:hypothetical protein